MKAIASPRLETQGSVPCDELGMLQGIANWLEDSIGEAAQRRDTANLLRHVRDRALLLMLYWRNVAVGELLDVQREDMQITPYAGIDCCLYAAGGTRRINWQPVRVLALAHLCPVCALTLWLSVSGIAGGPLFREITRAGALSGEAMRRQQLAALLRQLPALSGLGDEDSTYWLAEKLFSSQDRKPPDNYIQ